MNKKILISIIGSLCFLSLVMFIASCSKNNNYNSDIETVLKIQSEELTDVNVKTKYKGGLPREETEIKVYENDKGNIKYITLTYNIREDDVITSIFEKTKDGYESRHEINSDLVDQDKPVYIENEGITEE